MQLIAALVLAIALIVGAGPLCADPGAPTQAMAVGCADMRSNEAPGQDHSATDMAMACHACVFSPAGSAPPADAPVWRAPALPLMPVRAIVDVTFAPPTPPPRETAVLTIQPFIGARS